METMLQNKNGHFSYNGIAMSRKKKMLVWLGSYYPHEDAISNVILPLLKNLQKKWDITIYTRNPRGDAPLHEEHDGFHVYRDRIFDKDKEKRQKLFQRSWAREVNIDLTSHKLLFFKKLAIALLNLQNDKKWYGKLNQKEKWIQPFSEIAQIDHYDVILTITSPIQSQQDALKLYKKGYFARNHTLWIPYYVDPFATFIRHRDNPDQKYFLKFETEVYACADAVFTSPELAEDNLKYPMGKYACKTIPVQYASMKPCQDYPLPSFMDKNKINVVYTGSLFAHIVRRPDYFFLLASRLPEDFQVYIACGLIDKEDQILKEKYLDNHRNIHWLGRQPIDTCFSMMRNADVLVNLGNETENQTPSKVFDYIGMHRPIVSFYSLEYDTSLKYLKNYPYLLAIKNKPSLQEEDIRSFISFARLMKNTVIDDDSINRNYHQYLSSELARQFEEKLNKVINNSSK